MWLFYFLAILPLLFELMVFREPKKFIDYTKKLEERDKTKELTKTQRTFVLLNIGYYIWCFLGLLTSEWVIFLAILILSAIPKGSSIIMRRIDAFLTILLLVFMLINRFHLHIQII